MHREMKTSLDTLRQRDMWDVSVKFSVLKYLSERYKSRAYIMKNEHYASERKKEKYPAEL